VEELLYAAMEDYKLDILMGEGPHARSMQLTLPPFTLVGATTRSGLLSSPLRNRFGILMPLHFYAPKEMEALLFKASLKLNMTLSPEAQHQMAVCCRGTPRLALRLLRRVRDFAQVQGSRHITIELSSFALLEMGMTLTGLDPLDQRYLSLLGHHFKGGPTGLETLASAMSETKDTLEDIIEPYLMQQGLLQRTARGRLMTEKGWLILNAS
jgi:Holliday junction DNA helicase RuvB